MSRFIEGFSPYQPFEDAPDAIVGGTSLEVKNTPELPQVITPEVIMNANQTQEVEDNLGEFEYNRSHSLLAFDWECIDARNVRLLANETFYFNTIANGGNPEKIRDAVNSRVTKFGMVVAHGPDCGGRRAKKGQVESGIYVPDFLGLPGYVSREIDTPSVIQAGQKAKELSLLTTKQIAGMVRNHEDGSLRVMAVFNRNDGGLTTAMDEDLFTPGKDIAIRDDEMEYMAFDDLPEDILEYLIRHEEKRNALIETHPQGIDKMKEHNPRIAKIATNLRAAEVWIPDIALPGEIVRLTVPRKRVSLHNGEKQTLLNPQDALVTFEQAEYVIGNAVKNRGVEGAPFRDTDTLLIALPQYDIAQQLALQLAQQSFAEPWLDDERNKVLVAQNNDGHLPLVTELKFKRRHGQVIGFEEIARAEA